MILVYDLLPIAADKLSGAPSSRRVPCTRARPCRTGLPLCRSASSADVARCRRCRCSASRWESPRWTRARRGARFTADCGKYLPLFLLFSVHRLPTYLRHFFTTDVRSAYVSVTVEEERQMQMTAELVQHTPSWVRTRITVRNKGSLWVRYFFYSELRGSLSTSIEDKHIFRCLRVNVSHPLPRKT